MPDPAWRPSDLSCAKAVNNGKTKVEIQQLREIERQLNKIKFCSKFHPEFCGLNKTLIYKMTTLLNLWNRSFFKPFKNSKYVFCPIYKILGYRSPLFKSNMAIKHCCWSLKHHITQSKTLPTKFYLELRQNQKKQQIPCMRLCLYRRQVNLSEGTHMIVCNLKSQTLLIKLLINIPGRETDHAMLWNEIIQCKWIRWNI